jgi:hypothetical protein
MTALLPLTKIIFDIPVFVIIRNCKIQLKKELFRLAIGSFSQFSTKTISSYYVFVKIAIKKNVDSCCYSKRIIIINSSFRLQ